MKAKPIKHLKLVSKQPLKSSRQHQKSEFLMGDSRASFAPRSFETLFADGATTVFFRIYGTFEVPGSEIMTVSFHDKKKNIEFEVAFEEIFPITKKLRSMADAEKKTFVKTSLEKLDGGYHQAATLIYSRFLKKKSA